MKLFSKVPVCENRHWRQYGNRKPRPRHTGAIHFASSRIELLQQSSRQPCKEATEALEVLMTGG